MFCRYIAFNLLRNREDADECVNDAMLAAWDSIPPNKPISLRAYLGGITRNKALQCYRKRTAQKRLSGITVSLSELEECIPDAADLSDEISASELGELISDWLETLDNNDRLLFVRRYWYGDSLKELTEASGIPPGRLKKRMYGLRKRLKRYLERKGVSI